MAFLNPRTPPHIVTLVLVTGLAALSLNIFLPSLPNMARHFGVDYATMQLAISAYLAVSAALQLIIGPISDRYGRRPVLLAIIAIFILATLGTLLAKTAAGFLVARFVQATVATAFVLARAAVRDMVPGPSAASMIGYVTMGMSLVPMIGPVLGGIIDEAVGWRANFVVLLLCGVALFALVWADMGETVAGGGVSFRAQLAAYPQLARSQRFWGYSLAAATSAGLYYAYLGGAPIVGEQVFGLSAAQVGYYFALPSVGYMLGNWISGRYAVRLGMDAMVLSGTILTTVAILGALALQLAGLQTALSFFSAVGVTGIGNGLALPSANTGMMSVRPELAGTASGLGATLTIGGGATLSVLAVALMGPEASLVNLLLLMLATSSASVMAILWVYHRRRILGI